MGKAKTILIVAVDDEALLLSYLEHASGRYRLTTSRRISLSGNGKFPWLEDKRYSEQISAFLLQNRVSTETVILSISAQEAITSYVRLPEASREDAEAMLRFEIEKQIPIPLDNVHYGFRMRHVWGSKGLEAAVAAVDKATLERYIDLLEKAGLNPSTVCLDIEGHIKYWLDGQSAWDKAFLFLRVRPRSVDLCLVDKGLLKYFRSATREGEDPLLPLLKRELMAAGRLTEGYRTAELSFVAVSGLEEQEGSIAEGLGEALGLKVLLDHPDAGEKTVGQESMDAWSVLATQGLAHAVTESSELLDLLPTRFKKVKRKRPVSPMKVILVVAFVALGFLFGRAYNEREQLKAVNRKLESIKEQVFQVEGLGAEAQNYLSNLSALEALTGKEPRKLELLRELTVILPPNSWLSVLIYQNWKFDISGYAESASGLVPLLEESDYFKNAQFTAPIVQRPWGEEFKIRVDVER